MKATFENSRGPELHVNIWNLGGQLHGRCDHVHGFSVVAQRQKYVSQEHQTARGQPVEILGVGHLQGLPQVPPAIIQSKL